MWTKVFFGAVCLALGLLGPPFMQTRVPDDDAQSGIAVVGILTPGYLAVCAFTITLLAPDAWRMLLLKSLGAGGVLGLFYITGFRSGLVVVPALVFVCLWNAAGLMVGVGCAAGVRALIFRALSRGPN